MDSKIKSILNVDPSVEQLLQQKEDEIVVLKQEKKRILEQLEKVQHDVQLAVTTMEIEMKAKDEYIQQLQKQIK